MSLAKKAIFTSLSPNVEEDDIRLVLELIRKPGIWKKGEGIEKLEEGFKKFLGIKHAFSFNSGRSALLAILTALDIGKGDEVLLQAFTCNAAVNPILSRKALPVFDDIDDKLNLSVDNLKKKITPRTKAIIVQHTFGYPARVEHILKIAKENNLYLIEDCAHSLGARYKGRLCGSFGDASFFSLGRDKVISSVFGGMALTSNDKIGIEIKKFWEGIGFPSGLWTFQQLLHPLLANYLVFPAYGVDRRLGRIVLGIFHKLFILSKAVSRKEKRGKIPEWFVQRMANALAILAENQLKKLERFNRHRREIAEFYRQELKDRFEMPFLEEEKDAFPIFMRFPILTNKNTDQILKKAAERKIYLNDGWRKSPIVPEDTDLEKMRYKLGSCPRAEELAKRIVNLPTHINISFEKAERIVNFLKMES